MVDPYNPIIITADCPSQQQRLILESFRTVYCFDSVLTKLHKNILQRANHIAIVL